MMDDLISRAAAKFQACNWSVKPNAVIYDGIKEAIKSQLDMAPAVDAAPVVHGQWLGRRYDFKEYKYVIVPYDATTFDNPDNLFCSVCNTPALSNGAENDVPSNYCPHCGAKMDGERRDSE